MAHADPFTKPASAEARSHLVRGNKLYGIRSFDEAVEEYKAGALVEAAPIFDYNLGQCFRQLGKYQEAIWHYERFITRGDPQGEVLDAVNGFLAQMKSELDKKAMTQKPIEPGPGHSNPPQELQSSPILPPARAADVTRPVDRDDSPDWFGWSLTGSGVVMLGVSSVLFYRASQLNKQGDSESAMGARQNFYDQASSRNVAGVIVGTTGAAVTVIGAVRLIFHHRSPSQSTATTINIGITNRGVYAAGSF